VASTASQAQKHHGETTITVPTRERNGANGRQRNAAAKSGLLKVAGDFYILASAMSSRRTTRVLAQGESFAVFEATGDILESPLEALGFFHRDTRHLSRFEMMIAGEPPHLLNSYVSDDTAELRVNLTNPDLRDTGDSVVLARDLLQTVRDWVLTGGCLFQRITIRNYASATVKLALDFSYAADFADMFEVRGISRIKRGETHAPSLTRNTAEFSYTGIDGIRRSTLISFNHKPSQVTETGAHFSLSLKRGASMMLEARIEARHEQTADGKLSVPRGFGDALKRRRKEVAQVVDGFARITTSNQLANSLLERSLSDLAALSTVNGRGYYVMGGVPWFATLFGRDSIITGMSVLPFAPEVAGGILRTLANLQGSENNKQRDEQPGKIVHEIRGGEMANTGEVPFGRYYGSIDSTPLFLWLLGRYVSATADLELAKQLWPNVERALEWIEQYGDRDGDGYVEYHCETPRGLANQGWKDSFDAISHADGSLAQAPIALVEVQGYVYAAYCAIAELAGRLNQVDARHHFREEAKNLREQFERDFWLEKERTLALALDAQKRPCRVISSNPAHCLATGLLSPERAAILADRLQHDDVFSGWGLRTLGMRERRYNPMSYHNGSVWPHDNAMAAMGMAAIGRTDYAVRIMSGLFDAAAGLNHESLPELFCGFPREANLGPVPYPVACHPQAWSAASVFLLLQSILGMQVRGFEQRMVMRSPSLPEWLDWIRFDDLRLGSGTVSFIARRGRRGASIEVLEKRGNASVEVHK
jgi:glycogen debranching enzyme